jgi:acyl-CoA reductase-like NAD-dependent aldehyde dehydrogenase
VPHQNLIGGDWQPAADGATLAVVAPATGEPIGDVPASSAADVDAAVRAAGRAFDEWSAMTPRARSERLGALASLIEEHLSEISALESRNVGKPVSIMEFELDLALDNWRYFSAAGRFLEGRPAGEYLDGYTSMVRREPLGVVGSICPWNYPFGMATWKVAPALATGNTVVLKPSELTPYTAFLLGELAAEVLPAGVLNIVSGTGEAAGAALVGHPDVAMVSLTGSVASGQAVARAAADSL